MNIKDLEKKIDDIIINILKIKNEIKNYNNFEFLENKENKDKENKDKENKDKENKDKENKDKENKDFESLKKALENEKWPEAVNINLICDPDVNSDKLERARGIVELMIESDLKDLNFLDIGCGEGQVVAIASEYEPKNCIGYDCDHQEKWSELKKQNSEYTSNWNEVVSKGPYDVILLFDVLDHVKNENQISLLKKANQVLSDNGKIFIRCHPYVSKHGTHLYHHINKAYAHLVFTDKEISSLVEDCKHVEDTDRILMPLLTYEKFIKDAGLEIQSRREITSKVDPFFKIPKIAERIMKNNNFDSFPEFQMSLDFVDFVVKKSN